MSGFTQVIFQNQGLPHHHLSYNSQCYEFHNQVTVFTSVGSEHRALDDLPQHQLEYSRIPHHVQIELSKNSLLKRRYSTYSSASIAGSKPGSDFTVPPTIGLSDLSTGPDSGLQETSYHDYEGSAFRSTANFPAGINLCLAVCQNSVKKTECIVISIPEPSRQAARKESQTLLQEVRIRVMSSMEEIIIANDQI